MSQFVSEFLSVAAAKSFAMFVEIARVAFRMRPSDNATIFLLKPSKIANGARGFFLKLG